MILKAKLLVVLICLGSMVSTGCQAICPSKGCCQTTCLAPGVYRGGEIPPPERCETCNPNLPRCCHFNICYEFKRALFTAADSVHALACECPGIGRFDNNCCDEVPCYCE